MFVNSKRIIDGINKAQKSCKLYRKLCHKTTADKVLFFGENILKRDKNGLVASLLCSNTKFN